jgi:glyoxylase-like metal-dependent hydrolase (beta-lactamase superfamily II)
MNDPIIHTIDLNFRDKRGTIGTYLIPYSYGCIIIETGPGSTRNNLVAGLDNLGFKIHEVTDVFLTHIHLDHAGAAGWWAKQGSRIHVHENGAPHLINPERLLASAGRLYGDLMDTLWGEFMPVDEDHISIVHDQDSIQIGNLSIHALDTPGHANHHLVYLIGDACFSGDIGGIRLSPLQYLNLPMPPPDFNLEEWRSSIQRIQQSHPKRIIPTHFGIYSDAEWHLQAILNELSEVEDWMEAIMPLNLPIETLHQKFIEFEQMRAKKYGIDRAIVATQQIANPSFMSADGILRYWNKNHNPR